MQKNIFKWLSFLISAMLLITACNQKETEFYGNPLLKEYSESNELNKIVKDYIKLQNIHKGEEPGVYIIDFVTQKNIGSFDSDSIISNKKTKLILLSYITCFSNFDSRFAEAFYFIGTDLIILCSYNNTDFKNHISKKIIEEVKKRTWVEDGGCLTSYEDWKINYKNGRAKVIEKFY